MEEFKPNSHKSKQLAVNDQDEKRVTKAIVNGARVRKKGEIRKLLDVFMPDDIERVKSHVICDVLIPSIKKAMYDTIVNGTETVLYGDSGVNAPNRSTASKISYRQFYDNHTTKHTEQPTRMHSAIDFEDIIFSSRGEAESVLECMDDLVSVYGMLSIADMYDLAGITAPHTANNYGWKDISSARIVRIRDGYVIKLPRVCPLN